MTEVITKEQKQRIKIVKEAVDGSNIHLTRKKMLKDIGELLISKVQNFNESLFLENLQGLKTIVESDLDMYGKYNSQSNMLTVKSLDWKKTKQDNQDYVTMVHEILHLASTDRSGIDYYKHQATIKWRIGFINVSMNSMGTIKGTGSRGLNEGTTDLLTDRAMRPIASKSYPFWKQCAWALNWIFADDLVRKYFSSGLDDDLMNKMKEFMFSPEDADILIKNIDKCNIDIIRISEFKPEHAELVMSIQNLILDIYQKKIEKWLHDSDRPAIAENLKRVKKQLHTMNVYRFFTNSYIDKDKLIETSWRGKIFKLLKKGELDKFSKRIEKLQKKLEKFE